MPAFNFKGFHYTLSSGQFSDFGFRPIFLYLCNAGTIYQGAEKLFLRPVAVTLSLSKCENSIYYQAMLRQAQHDS